MRLVLAITTPQQNSSRFISKDSGFHSSYRPIDAGLVEALEKPGREVTGTSDQAPVGRQIDLLLSLKEMSNIGLIYNAAEPNSVVQAAEAETQIEKAGKKVVAVTVASTNDVQQAMTTLNQGRWHLHTYRQYNGQYSCSKWHDCARSRYSYCYGIY